MPTLKEFYPVVFEGYITLLKNAFNEKFYAQQVNVLDVNIEVPCLYISAIQLPSEAFCGDINNVEIRFSMGIATRKADVNTIEATKKILSMYGEFGDNFDSQTHSFTFSDKTIELKGDIIDNTPRMMMQDDGAYGIKILTFDYSYEVLRG